MHPSLKVVLLAAAVALPAAAHAQLNPNKLYADTNGDGKVSLTEYQVSRSTFLMRADRDKDGKITQQEWAKAAQMLRARVEMAGVDGADLIGRAGLFAVVDANKDGVVTTPEIDVVSRHQFSLYDTDKDGQVTKTEARAAERMAHAN